MQPRPGFCPCYRQKSGAYARFGSESGIRPFLTEHASAILGGIGMRYEPYRPSSSSTSEIAGT